MQRKIFLLLFSLFSIIPTIRFKIELMKLSKPFIREEFDLKCNWFFLISKGYYEDVVVSNDQVYRMTLGNLNCKSKSNSLKFYLLKFWDNWIDFSVISTWCIIDTIWITIVIVGLWWLSNLGLNCVSTLYFASTSKRFLEKHYCNIWCPYLFCDTIILNVYWYMSIIILCTILLYNSRMIIFLIICGPT